MMQEKLLQEFLFWDSVLLSQQTSVILQSCTADLPVQKAAGCQECSLRNCDLFQLVLGVQERSILYPWDFCNGVEWYFFSQFNFISLLSLMLRSVGFLPTTILVLFYCHLILRWQFLFGGESFIQIDATHFFFCFFSCYKGHTIWLTSGSNSLVKSHLAWVLMLFEKRL